MPDSQPDFDGCNSECRKAGRHTLRWGGCENAPEPEPTLNVLRVRNGSDDQPQIVTETITLMDLTARIDAAMSTVKIRFGPNALAMLERGEQVGLSLGERHAMALCAAMALTEDHAAPTGDPS
jgi:hypothetical protein